MQPVVFSQKVDGLIDRLARAGATRGFRCRGCRRCAAPPAPLRARASRRTAHAPEGCVGLREEGDVHVGEQLPVFFGAPPGQRLAKRMTVVACGAKRFVRDDLVLNAVFRNVHQGLRLFGSQPVIGGQIFQDRTRFRGLERGAVEPHHPFDCLFPSLGCGAFPGDAREVALVVLLVTCAAA